MFLNRAWYVAGVSTELGEKPLYRQIAGQHVVLFRDATGTVKALSALCPHRGHNLGLGRVVNGDIRCPWHGWSFNGAGRCTSIPSQPASRPIPEVARVARYPVTEQHGLLWIWMDPQQDPKTPPERIAILDTAGALREYEKPALAHGGWMNHLENTLNGAHLSFVHTGSMGPDLPAIVGEESVTFNTGMSGFVATQSERAKASGVASELNIIHAGPMKHLRRLIGLVPVKRRLHYFQLPGVTLVHQEFENGTTESYLGAVTPANAEQTWFFLGCVRTRGLNPLGNLMQRRFMKQLLAEDVGICESALAGGPFGLPQPLSVGSDVKMLAFRKIYARAMQAEDRPVPWPH
jgi:phenylpropionate dioxygenase-like ring-hydroxylating dioxygenase large terminal subunit